MKHQADSPSIGSRSVIRLSLLQALVTLILAAGYYFHDGRGAAIAALLGGLICAVANLFFAGRLFATNPDMQAQSMVYRFYRSEAMKVVFTLSMFVICIVIVKVQALPFIIAYLVTALLVNWLFLLIDN